MSVKINRKEWSKESKQSVSYYFSSEFYEDIPYFCYKCGEHAIYTAKEQKETFEVRKQHICQSRNICPMCHRKYKQLKAQISSYEDSWKTESEKTKNHASFLKKWLAAINDVPTYGKAKNESMATHLFKLINRIT